MINNGEQAEWTKLYIFYLSGSLILLMGTICISKETASQKKTQSEKDKQVIKINDSTNTTQLRFQVTTDKLIHISADLLVLFMDHTTNIKRNDHFIKLPVQGMKLEQHAVAFLQRHKLSDSKEGTSTKFITCNVIIPTLNFNKVSIIFCDTWKEDVHNQTLFNQTLKDYFDSISKQAYKNIAFTEFTSELGVHLQKGAKRIMLEIIRMEHKPQVIQFCCLTEESKGVFTELINSNREELARSIVSKPSNLESDYF